MLKEMGKKYFNFDNKESKLKPNKPWWNETCYKIIKNRNKNFNKWRRKPNKENKIEYKKNSQRKADK